MPMLWILPHFVKMVKARMTRQNMETRKKANRRKARKKNKGTEGT